jgi:peptidoglycan/LPS O-acetylase OafA/YrhL
MTRPPQHEDKAWRWLTFPVLAAFVFGVLVASFIDRPDSDFAVAVRIVAVVLSAACLAHIVGRYVIVPMRMRGGRADAVQEPYVEELVYEDEG